MISQYWLNQVPISPLVIEVRSGDGTLFNLLDYTDVKIKLLNPYNEVVPVDGFTVDLSNGSIGRAIIEWPSTTVLQTTGEYVLQLELVDGNRSEFTDVHTIVVNELGVIDNVRYSRIGKPNY